MPADSREERAALAAISTFRTSGSAYLQEQATRPQTIGYSPAGTPVGLAAWLLDHDETTNRHLAQLFAGHPYGAITRDDFLLAGNAAKPAKSAVNGVALSGDAHDNTQGGCGAAHSCRPREGIARLSERGSEFPVQI